MTEVGGAPGFELGADVAAVDLLGGPDGDDFAPPFAGALLLPAAATAAAAADAALALALELDAAAEEICCWTS
ncbi:MAG: hypothetical protein ACJ786_26775, partial [Catenulispora sp.]